MFNNASDSFTDIFAAANHRQLLKLRIMHVLLEMFGQLRAFFLWTCHPWNEMHANNGTVECKLFEVSEKVVSAVRL